MRRIWVATALAGTVAASGCGQGGGGGSGTNPGIREGTFLVTVQNTAPLAITGGKVTSAPGGIECGVGVAVQKCEASFAIGSSVTLTATPVAPNLFLGWAGDCSGEGGCVLTGNADRYVVARFGTERTGHPNWTDGQVHAAKYFEFANGTPGALQCTQCHGATLQGQGLAIGCGTCHAAPASNFAPQLASAISGRLAGAPVQVTLSASDANTSDAIRCSATLLSQPAGSAVALSNAGPIDCRAAAQVVSFTPAASGLYTLRATVTDGKVTTVRDVYAGATAYTGGQVTGVAAAPADTMAGVLDRLRLDIAALPSYGTGKNAADLYREFANFSAAANPDGSYTQGPLLAWSARPYDVIDIRDGASFAAGHMPGAVNVPLQDLPDVLLASPWFPAADQASSKRALVVGYTQGDSSLGAIIVTAGRAASGATVAAGNVNFLNQGMATWTFDKASVPFRWSDDLGTYRFEFKLSDVGPNGPYLESGGGPTFSFAGKPTYGFPVIADFGGGIDTSVTTTPAAMKRILVRLREWSSWARQDALAHGRSAAEAFVANWGFYKQLRDSGEAYHELTRQTDAEWATARAVGAYRGDLIVNSSGVLTQANFKYVDPTRETLLNCYTNGSAVRPGFVMSVLGYKLRTVIYGIGGLLSWDIVGAGSTGANGWNNINALKDSGTGGNEFPTSKLGVDPQDLAWTQPAANGCRECHRDYGAIYTAVARMASQTAVGTASEGEG